MLRPAARALCAIMLVASSGLTASAHAQRTSSLSWVRLAGAESCISTQALAERVEQRVGRAVFVSASQADLSLEGHVERVAKPSAWLATLVVSDREGHVLGRRVLHARGERCEELEASLVLVIAIAIDPNARLDARSGAPAQGLSPEAKSMLEQLGLPELDEQQLRDELAVPSPLKPAPEGAPRVQPRAQSAANAPGEPPSGEPAPTAEAGSAVAFVRITAEAGALPDPSAGAALGARLEPRFPLSFELWVSALLPQREALSTAAASVHYQFFAGGFGLCPILYDTLPWQLHACAGSRVGIVSAYGQAFVGNATARAIWFEPTAYGVVDWRFGRFAFEALLGGGVPIVRDTFAYEDKSGARHPAHRAAAVTGRVELGGALRF